MKVLLVNDCPTGLEGSGGVETHIQQLQEALCEQHIETAILTHQYRNKPEVLEEKHACIHELNAPALRKHWLQNIRNRNLALHKAQTFIQHFNPDVIHVHNMMNPVTLKFLHRFGPIVKSIHDCRPFCVKPYPVVASRLIGNSDHFCDITFGARCWSRCYAAAGSSWTEKFEAWATFPANLRALQEICHTDHLILYSQYLKDLATRCVTNRENLHILHHFTAAEEASQTIYPDPTGEFTFLFAGRLSYEKGILDVLAALQELTDTPCRLLIAGDGPLRNIVRQTISERHSNHDIKMLGFLDQEDLYKLYRDVDVLLFPSYGSEGCPLTGIEAMYFNTPAIGYDSGGINEWLVNDQTGILLKRRDISGLVQAMHLLAHDREKTQQLGRLARKYVSDKFRLDKHLRKLVSVYEQAINGTSCSNSSGAYAR